jgi:hypothetical protein
MDILIAETMSVLKECGSRIQNDFLHEPRTWIPKSAKSSHVIAMYRPIYFSYLWLLPSSILHLQMRFIERVKGKDGVNSAFQRSEVELALKVRQSS